MPEQLWKTIEEWRDKGIAISNQAAEMIYSLCLRKMEVAHVKNPGQYINLLYPDEVRNYLIRQSANSIYAEMLCVGS